ncbi:hypothetical protein B5X24_HaOG208400 [Helicoverpa armigera]|uniref:DNA replication licensing factor MCM3 n=1 Tax=Helicoverpa armigera TaxID=29058 RepID=A0A2W1BIC1_HELAM|nr:hypothetical protein B5X24_HaOG208400 [Helicoverpa armigera]
MEDGDFDQRLRDLQREYLEFLDDEEDQGIYMEKVKQMIADKSQRLLVSINDLRRKNPERARTLLENAFEEQIAFQKALKEYVSSIDPTYAKEQEEFFVAFNGSFGNKHVTPRSLTSRYLGNLICVEGIVTRVSLVRPKVVRSVHYCPATKKVMERKYTDLTSFEAFPTSAVYPTKDDEGNPLETEYGLSRYKDHQTLTVQEMPERAPAGQLPRSVDIICDDDLVDKCKPGDRVQIVGNYRCLPNKQGSFTAGTFRTILIANNVTEINKDMNMNITLEDVKLCKRLAKRGTADMFDLLSKSLAPSIHGHDYIKKAILCLLLGGMEKVLPNGTRLRGDINILLIGDPSVAKSQLLRYVLQTAPRAITTTGRGSSGVGLTAAVTTDPETGDRRLPAAPRAKKSRKTGAEGEDPYAFSSDEEAEPVLRAAHSSQPEPSQRTTRSSQKTTIEGNRLTQFKSALQQLFREERANSLPLSRVTSYVNDKYSHETFSDGEVNAALQQMTHDNQVMMADDIVFLI